MKVIPDLAVIIIDSSLVTASNPGTFMSFPRSVLTSERLLAVMVDL